MKKVFFMGAVCIVANGWFTLRASEQDSVPTFRLDEVMVSAVRAKQTLPVTFSNLSQKEIQKRNAGLQIPMLLGLMPNVVSFSEDGTGVGATHLSVRGSDTYRTNVTINGIPYNDSESQGTFWYNLSDFAASAQNIQLQRGVGTSTNGAGAFGASVNVLTDAVSLRPFATIDNYWGSYNTCKHLVKFSTGKLNNGFELSGRFSQIASDGYRNRATSDLKSYFLQGAYAHENTLIKALIFGGKEKTGLTYLGIDKNLLQSNRRFNPSGEMYTDSLGRKHFYDNETDNYQQDHAQLHWVQRWSDHLTSNAALHYTKGKGFWEMYETWPGDGKHQIMQYAMDNDFYGATFSLNYQRGDIDLIFGSSYNQYDGFHYDERVWSQEANMPHRERLDEDWGYKKDGAAFVKLSWQMAPRWSLFGDVQYRYVHYRADKYKANEDFHLFNPKLGVSFLFNHQNSFYASYAKATKEPNRSDYKNSYKHSLNAPKPEKLNDFELGWRYVSPLARINANLYYMLYKDQLVLTGRLNDKGYPIRSNSGKSYRMGVEVDATVALSGKWLWQPNISLSRNKNVDFYIETANATRNIGNTNISFSPNVVASNTLAYSVMPQMNMALTTKFVGEQYMTNTDESAAKLDAYSVTNFNLSYELLPSKFCKSVTLSLLINNVFNTKYVASGTFEDGAAAYFPQAEANFMLGASLKF